MGFGFFGLLGFWTFGFLGFGAFGLLGFWGFGGFLFCTELIGTVAFGSVFPLLL